MGSARTVDGPSAAPGQEKEQPKQEPGIPAGPATGKSGPAHKGHSTLIIALAGAAAAGVGAAVAAAEAAANAAGCATNNLSFDFGFSGFPGATFASPYTPTGTDTCPPPPARLG